MLNNFLRAATGSILLAASLGAAASQPMPHPVTIAGAYQEFVGPSARCPANFGGTIVGHGASALLGRVAFIASDCITPSGPLFNFNEGHFVIMTVTGDQVFANYSGQFVPTGVGTNYVFSGATFQITGGNGRYAKATGGGSLAGGSDMATGIGNLQLTGQISYADK